jgi:copper chaperone CopZ
MKKNYAVEGMTCGGCVSKVKEALLQLPDVTDVEVKLRPEQAIVVITMNKSIGIKGFQAKLIKTGHYTIKSF